MLIKPKIKVIKKADRLPRHKGKRLPPAKTAEQEERSLIAKVNSWVDEAKRKEALASIKDQG